MPANSDDPVDLDAVDARFRQWRAHHRTPSTVRVAHQEVILERVAQSMAFEGDPITVTRLKALLNQVDPWPKN
jgi:hypothetical protein